MSPDRTPSCEHCGSRSLADERIVEHDCGHVSPADAFDDRCEKCGRTPEDDEIRLVQTIEHCPECGYRFSLPSDEPTTDTPFPEITFPVHVPSERPAIGIVARDEDADAIYRTILRAKERGYKVYLTASDPRSETVRFAERLGAEAITHRPAATRLELESTLSAVARAGDHPGIIFQLEGCPKIDYERTLEAFKTTEFEVQAVPQAWVNPDGRVHLLAAIPAYNAADTIGEVVEGATNVADLVLVVDDGSTDTTVDRAKGAGALVVSHSRNRGYGGALKTIFEESRKLDAAHLVTLDADGQHDPRDIPKLVEAQKSSGTEILIGSRYVLGSNTQIPLVRSIGLGVVNLLTNASLGRFRPGTWIQDTQSGFRAYTRDAVESFATADIGNGMGASTDIIYHASQEGFGFGEVGATISYDVEEASTHGVFSHGSGLVRNILGFLEQKHPLLVLGVPGLMSIFLGTFFGILSIELLLTNQVSGVTILATLLFSFAGTTMVFFALFLHIINTHPYFRRTLHQS